MRKLLRKLIIIMNKLLKIVLGLTLALALVVGVGAVRASAAGLGDSGAAVSALQAAYASEILAPLGLTAPTGFAGTLTMAKIAALKAGGSPVVGTFPAGCTSSAGFSSTTGMPCSGSTTTTTTTTLGSGDGDITTVTETSSADSSVNEGESNEIFGFQAEIEGDVKIDRVDIYLESDSAASENANDYF